MNLRIAIPIAVLSLLAIAGGIFYAIAEKADLLVDGNTMVWAQPDFDVERDTPIAALHKGEVIHIEECLDMKTDFVYQVKLPDGRLGYVSPGEYRLKISHAWEASGPLVSNCH